MQIVTGIVAGGKVVMQGASLPEGTLVTVLTRDSEPTVRLPAKLQAELETILDEADREEGIPGDALLKRLERYG